MGKMIRATVIGLLNEGVTFEDIQAFVDEKLSAKALGDFRIVRGEAHTEAGEKRLFIKFSKLMPIEVIDDRWNIDLSHQFRQAGYGDVAWKFTEVNSDDPAAEDTTETLQPELFQACLDAADPSDDSSPLSGAVGSDVFWQWFDDREE
jgi:hypothetical protein